MEPISEVVENAVPAATAIQMIGAFGFGLLVGWYVYYINRYRKGDVQWSDLVTLLGIIGGTAILSLFPEGTDLFGAYGLGLAVGFFAYFIVLLVMVGRSRNFNVDWFLDGRRKLPSGKIFLPQVDDPRGSAGLGMVDEPPSDQPPAGGPGLQ
jgi:hypothetical protein